ncbi:MAG: diguanylate cyclase [Campylobacterales bacterium]|nr:diguanylate cyclase [Campylobacterales bacterium]
MKLYHKILILTLLQLVAIFAFGIYQIQSLYLAQEKAFEQKIVLQNEIVSQRFGETLKQLQSSADILSNSQEVTTGLISNDTDMLYNWSHLFLTPSVQKIHFIDLTGTVISRGEAEFRFGDNLSTRSYFQQALREGTFLGIDTVDGEECLVYAKKIRQYGERPIGIISVALAIDEGVLASLAKGTSLDIAYHSSHQVISTSKKTPFIRTTSSHSIFQGNNTQEAVFSIGLTRYEELAVFQKTRTNLFLSIALIFSVLLVALHFTLHKHIKEHEQLVQLLIDFYENHLDIKTMVSHTRHVLTTCSTPEIKKTARALLNMGEKIANTQEALELLSTTDALTGLFNRRKVEACLDQKLKEGARETPFALIMIDIDHFKMINDTYGHEVGDYVLVDVAKLLQASVRQSDILGRWGGEEFLLILPKTSPEGALRLAEELRFALEQHVSSAYPNRISASFGVAHYRPKDTANLLIRRADIALYRAKHNGRNGVEYEA